MLNKQRIFKQILKPKQSLFLKNTMLQLKHVTIDTEADTRTTLIVVHFEQHLA